ncbi:MAG: HAD hydrolase family protein, partial [Theionarchaea archaeon]|nr:HAD hydrolase family protein [Theionarchaea archaeon]
ERLNISLEEMIAFGDGMNDLEMLSCVGYPVAVGNAVERIKKVVENRGGYRANQEYGKGVLEAADHILETIL